MLVEQFHQLAEVQQTAAQAVDFVNHNAVDQTGLDVRDQPFEGRPVHVGASEPTVVVERGEADPTFARQALDERFPRISLGIEAVVVLLETFLGAFPRVDRTPDHSLLFLRAELHLAPPFLPTRKNRFPEV